MGNGSLLYIGLIIGGLGPLIAAVAAFLKFRTDKEVGVGALSKSAVESMQIANKELRSHVDDQDRDMEQARRRLTEARQTIDYWQAQALTLRHIMRETGIELPEAEDGPPDSREP